MSDLFDDDASERRETYLRRIIDRMLAEPWRGPMPDPGIDARRAFFEAFLRACVPRSCPDRTYK